MHSGITLDAVSVRQEINDRLDNGEITEAQAEYVNSLSDEEINAAIDASVNDYFWNVYDFVRSAAIARLLSVRGV